MRAAPLLAVAALHGALLLALCPPVQRAAPAVRRELVVRLLPATAASVAPAPRALPPVLVVPAVASVAPPSFDVPADGPGPAAPVAMTPAATPVQVAFVVPPAARDAEPPLQAARRTACAPAPHPPSLRERGIEGVVRLRVWVDELGRAGQILLAASSGWRLFDDAAVAQARRCPFQPALRGTQPVGSWVEFPVRFTLETSNG
ncbi:energy transducer TonB [Pelomonas aquatica]|uniref:TonB family protein n=1 Tax=Pelomonas aquatica TaxID=431058 RepID=A0A9X4R3Y9_9BURK|nr:TonB family protein [Pelomonas aquatica]MCY4754742.1 TonB family protein [Pelomonas aquatica]MDG0861945.1 TonB family protein [Pelomonas aquatica]